MNDAVKRGASDIHFEPEESFLRVRYRIDGVLRQIRSLHRKLLEQHAVRLKVMSEMNIAESRLPQDGRISLRFTVALLIFALLANRQPTVKILLCGFLISKGIFPRWKTWIKSKGRKNVASHYGSADRCFNGNRPNRQW